MTKDNDAEDYSGGGMVWLLEKLAAVNRSFGLLLLAFLVPVATSGCTRTRYRTAADRDAYCIVQEKSQFLTEDLPDNFTVRPDQRSRFYDPTNPDCPQLPVPRPVLRGYDLPMLASDAAQLPAMPAQELSVPGAEDARSTDGMNNAAPENRVPAPPAEPIAPPAAGATSESSVQLSTTSPPPGSAWGRSKPAFSEASEGGNVIDGQQFAPTVNSESLAAQPNANTASSPVAQVTANMPLDGYSSRNSAVITAAFQPPTLSEPNSSQATDAAKPSATGDQAASTEPPSAEPPNKPAEAAASPPSALVNKVTIPAKAWEVLPQSCIDRMLEFQSLRDEYAQSFKGAKLDNSAAGKRPLTLANLMELANINSREYQARKEVLFRAALALTRQRYQYELNPIPFGNGTAANYRHLRNGGIEQNTLSVPTGVGVQRTLATGGQFLATFANRWC